MLEKELSVVKEVVKIAGREIIRIADEYYSRAQENVDRSAVTKADLAADKILRETLMRFFPEYGWLSEETEGDSRRFKCDRVWIVDPMDGTREFCMKVPEFVVSVALVENGEVVLGVLYNPCTEDLYEAALGQGTRFNGVPVKCDHALRSKPKVEVSRSDIEKEYFAGYETALNLSPCGSIAYKLARLAAGKADGTLSVTPKNEWDVAGGVILVTEAGGQVTDLAGNRYLFNQVDTLVNGVIAASTDAYGIIKDAVDARRI